MQANCYIVFDDKSKQCAIIDPGGEFHKINKVIDDLKLKPQMIIVTHGHIDHIGAIDKFNLPVYVHKSDAQFLTDPRKNLSHFFALPLVSKSEIKKVEDKDKIKFDDICFEVIHTPGHTPGGMCLKLGNILFSGDTLFYQGIGRADFEYGSEDELFKSIKEKLFPLSDDVKVCPGHGPASTIGEEKRSNPFFE